MEQLRNLGDERHMAFCVYCGGMTETRDHVPPKVFLDEPYPSNLSVVPACKSCNGNISRDEEYVSCLIECACTGSIGDIQRQKVRNILQRKPALVSKLKQAFKVSGKDKYIVVETKRANNLILKLARGHVAFELNEPHLAEPFRIAFVPIVSLPLELLKKFETPPGLSILPEIGSRSFQRVTVLHSLGKKPDVIHPGWIEPQKGMYRYLTSIRNSIVVRIVIREYLACEVVWRLEYP